MRRREFITLLGQRDGRMAARGARATDGDAVIGYLGAVPVQQVTKGELFINLKAAKTLGVIFPPSLLGRADDVIS